MSSRSHAAIVSGTISQLPAAGTTTTEQGDVLTFGPIRTTRMACAEPASGLEATVLRVLESDPTYMITGNTMVLTAVDGTTLEYLAD